MIPAHRNVPAFAKIAGRLMLAASLSKGARMKFLNGFEPQAKSVLRIVTGLLFFSIGLVKIVHFPMVPSFAHVTPIEWPEGPAGLIELTGGALVMLGFYSRIAAFICSGEMAFAYFIAHFPKSPLPILNGGFEAILFCFVFLYLAVPGPGPWAINKK